MQHLSVAPAPARRMRRPRGLVITDPPPDEIGAEVDWSSWYLSDEEDMAHAPEHNEAAAVFQGSLAELARERGWESDRLGEDEFFGWVPGEPLVRVSPDVFIHPQPPPPPLPRMWETWRPGHYPPRFALEIVSEDWKKDYEDNPTKYWQLGARELVIFDPGARGAAPVPIQIYRRDPDESFVRVYAGPGPAYSAELDAWLVIHGEGPSARLRLTRDAAGTDLVPTAAEAREAAEHAKREAEAARDRAEHARREAEQELARLREVLARSGDGQR